MMEKLLPDWIPYKIAPADGDIKFQWLFLNDKTFTEPFFQDTVTHCMNYEVNRKLDKPKSTIDQLLSFSELADAPEPSAFIFHISRCGSTLMAQLLSLNPAHTVLSEVPLLDEILRLPFRKNSQINKEQALRLFKALLQLIARKRRGDESKLFVKTDSWHLLFYPLIRSLYPTTPFIILYRDPVEVIRSQQKLRGMQSVPGTIEPEIFGFTEADISFNLDLYMSRVLCRYFETILEMTSCDPFTNLINYNEGFPLIMERVKRISGTNDSTDWHQEMIERCRFHGKYSGEVFNKEPVIETRPHWLERCFELYEKVDQKRKLDPACISK